MPSYLLTRKDILIQLQRYGIDISQIPDNMNDEGLMATLDFIESIATKHGMATTGAVANGLNHIMERGA